MTRLKGSDFAYIREVEGEKERRSSPGTRREGILTCNTGDDTWRLGTTPNHYTFLGLGKWRIQPLGRRAMWPQLGLRTEQLCLRVHKYSLRVGQEAWPQGQSLHS